MDITSFSAAKIPSTSYKFFNIRGYGNIHAYTINDSKLSVTSKPYNKLEPLQAPFGSHLPKKAEQKYLDANPQITIAWRN